MESLAYVALAVITLLLAAVCGGLWLLHTALNDGDIWKGVVAGIFAIGGGMMLTGMAAAGR